MARVRNNQGHRNKILNIFMRPYLEQENTQEREAYLQARETIKPLQDQTWQLAKEIVSRHYTPEDIKMAYHLQNKFDNVNTIAKDSCFHFGYMNKADGDTPRSDGEYGNDNRHDDNDDENDKYITKHFDFRLDGNINGSENSRQNDFAYAYFRDELKAKDGCNPDINIEQHGKENNPHKTKYQDNNDRALGFNSGRDNLTSYSDKWDKEYELDLIGREYCRDRQIAVQKEEFQTFLIWQQAKGQITIAHHKWVESILKQMKFVKDVIKGYKYLDEAIELATELGLNISEAEIIRTNSTGLVIYNPKNLADRIKGMKNKKVKTQAEKIAERMAYMQQSTVAN